MNVVLLLIGLALAAVALINMVVPLGLGAIGDSCGPLYNKGAGSCQPSWYGLGFLAVGGVLILLALRK